MFFSSFIASMANKRQSILTLVNGKDFELFKMVQQMWTQVYTYILSTDSQPINNRL